MEAQRWLPRSLKEVIAVFYSDNEVASKRCQQDDKISVVTIPANEDVD
jgi:hypothetical protein